MSNALLLVALIYLATVALTYSKASDALEGREHLLELLPGMVTIPATGDALVKAFLLIPFYPIANLAILKPSKMLVELEGLSEVRVQNLRNKQVQLTSEEYSKLFKEELAKGPSPKAVPVKPEKEAEYTEIVIEDEDDLAELLKALISEDK